MESGEPVRVVRIARPPRSLCNFKRFESLKSGRPGPAFLTSVGAYRSALDVQKSDEAAAKAKSIHDTDFKPGGRWDYARRERENTGFANAGHNVPDEVPESVRVNNGDHYSVGMHQFRACAPKQTLYM